MKAVTRSALAVVEVVVRLPDDPVAPLLDQCVDSGLGIVEAGNVVSTLLQLTPEAALAATDVDSQSSWGRKGAEARQVEQKVMMIVVWRPCEADPVVALVAPRITQRHFPRRQCWCWCTCAPCPSAAGAIGMRGSEIRLVGLGRGGNRFTSSFVVVSMICAASGYPSQKHDRRTRIRKLAQLGIDRDLSEQRNVQLLGEACPAAAAEDRIGGPIVPRK